MAALGHISPAAELTWLRNRVADLERELQSREDHKAALDESRHLFDVFLTNLPALAWMKDELGRYVYANRRFHDLTESAGATCLGATDADLWPAPLAGRLREADIRSADAAFRITPAEVLPLPGGDRSFRIHRFPFHSRTGKCYLAGVAIDITSRAAIETAGVRNSVFYQSDLAGILECEGGRVVNGNDLILKWLGYSCEDLHSGKLQWSALTPPRFHETDRLALEEASAEGSCRPYEKELLDRHGDPVPVLVAISATGAVGTFVCQLLNLSDRRQMESRLLRSQKLESLGLIAGGVAHDFNNLLASIMGNASLSADAIPRDHPACKSLNEVVIASRRASDLTQQVLAYSGRANFQIKPVSISASVQEIGSLLETTISKKISLNFQLGRNLPLVEADEGQLQQVIMNLVINAADAIGENAGEIVISTRAERGTVWFEVSDTGCGMSDETKARIFDPFFTTKTDGRGLGLAAVLGIVRNHFGSLFVDTEMGRGTTFRVMFPASAVAPAREAAAHPRQDLHGTETILVADDDDGIRRMARVALERFGYKVLVAANGAEAVDVFREHSQDIAAVILDWAMPVMNGDEALDRILAIDPHARVLMSSGYAETETLQRVDNEKLAGFVQKPYTTTQLAERLRETISCNRFSLETHAGS